jgi:cysteine synthase A
LFSPGFVPLIEPTIRNLGIRLAFIASQKGCHFSPIMPANYALDKQMLLRSLGAELILTGGKLG